MLGMRLWPVGKPDSATKETDRDLSIFSCVASAYSTYVAPRRFYSRLAVYADVYAAGSN